MSEANIFFINQTKVWWQIVHWIKSSKHENSKLKPGENMLCEEIVIDILNNFCTQLVLLMMFCKKKSFRQRFACDIKGRPLTPSLRAKGSRIDIVSFYYYCITYWLCYFCIWLGIFWLASLNLNFEVEIWNTYCFWFCSSSVKWRHLWMSKKFAHPQGRK